MGEDLTRLCVSLTKSHINHQRSFLSAPAPTLQSIVQNVKYSVSRSQILIRMDFFTAAPTYWGIVFVTGDGKIPIGIRLSPPERRYADVLGLSDWPRYPDSGLAEPKGNKLHDLR